MASPDAAHFSMRDVIDYNMVSNDLHETHKDIHYVPCHCMFYDHLAKEIIIAIRGTASVSDAIYDLVCKSAPFMGGQAHEGVKTAAESLWKVLKPVLNNISAKYKSYKIKIVGHSLGAGTSILLSMLMFEVGK